MSELSPLEPICFAERGLDSDPRTSDLESLLQYKTIGFYIAFIIRHFLPGTFDKRGIDFTFNKGRVIKDFFRQGDRRFDSFNDELIQTTPHTR
ncbi:hypothetical protein V144x_54640 [Gimesia aquarii]|uniref:Uncharacterized protein n=1 Tax=Gimesia aquarii TaxID=2527964 RepID=A0A517W3Y6_9PLAN|nr:hypothetical protein V144x_54640 [Gimesia aquarii]